MTGIQIFLIFVGILAIVCSFVFAEKLESKDNSVNQKVLNQDIEKLTKDIVSEQVSKEVDRIIDDKIEITEVEMEKISNEKILAMGDYYETVIGEISKNHDEVMFLYGMLNDKEKDIKNTVMDVENVKKSIQKSIQNSIQNSISGSINNDSLNNNIITNNSDANSSLSDNSSVNDSNIDVDNITEDAEKSENVDYSSIAEKHKDNVSAAKDVIEEKKQDKGVEDDESDVSTGSENYRKKGVALSHEEARKNTNNTQMILELYNEGKTNIEIAKQLKLGVGEVRLTIDLYKNRR